MAAILQRRRVVNRPDRHPRWTRPHGRRRDAGRILASGDALSRSAGAVLGAVRSAAARFPQSPECRRDGAACPGSVAARCRGHRERGSQSTATGTVRALARARRNRAARKGGVADALRRRGLRAAHRVRQCCQPAVGTHRDSRTGDGSPPCGRSGARPAHSTVAHRERAALTPGRRARYRSRLWRHWRCFAYSRPASTDAIWHEVRTCRVSIRSASMLQC